MYMAIYALGVGLVHILVVNMFAYIYFSLSNVDFFPMRAHTHAHTYILSQHFHTIRVQ